MGSLQIVPIPGSCLLIEVLFFVCARFQPVSLLHFFLLSKLRIVRFVKKLPKLKSRCRSWFPGSSVLKARLRLFCQQELLRDACLIAQIGFFDEVDELFITWLRWRQLLWHHQPAFLAFAASKDFRRGHRWLPRWFTPGTGQLWCQGRLLFQARPARESWTLVSKGIAFLIPYYRSNPLLNVIWCCLISAKTSSI